VFRFRRSYSQIMTVSTFIRECRIVQIISPIPVSVIAVKNVSSHDFVSELPQ